MKPQHYMRAPEASQEISVDPHLDLQSSQKNGLYPNTKGFWALWRSKSRQSTKPAPARGVGLVSTAALVPALPLRLGSIQALSVSKNRGPLLGVLIARIRVYWGLVGGTPFLETPI